MLSRKKENRKRARRENVLDVKARSDSAGRRRLHIAGMAVLFCVGIVGGVWGAWQGGEYLLDRFVYENKSFSIAKIDIRSNGVITRERLLHWAGIAEGDNLIDLDLPAIKRNLELAPNIRSVSLERQLPNTLKIRVWERQPIARVVAVVPKTRSGRFTRMEYLLDAEGFVMLPVDPQWRVARARQREKALPMLVNLDPAELRVGQQVGSLGVRAALDLVIAFPGSPMLGEAMLTTIDVSAPTTLLVSDENGARITFGLENHALQLARWRLIRDRGTAQGLRIESLDVSISNNVPAVWRTAGEESPPESATANESTIPHRRTNV